MITCNNYYDVVDKLKNTKLSNVCKLDPTTEAQALMFRHMRTRSFRQFTTRTAGSKTTT